MQQTHPPLCTCLINCLQNATVDDSAADRLRCPRGRGLSILMTTGRRAVQAGGSCSVLDQNLLGRRSSARAARRFIVRGFLFIRKLLFRPSSIGRKEIIWTACRTRGENHVEVFAGCGSTRLTAGALSTLTFFSFLLVFCCYSGIRSVASD